MKNQINFTEPKGLECFGTSFHYGIVKATAKEISKFLGKASPGWDDKTTHEWRKKCGSVVFTVYDYKEYRRITANTLVEYHIGTKCPEDTGIIVEMLKSLGLDAYIEK